MTPAVVEEYEMGPLPLPTSYSRISHSHHDGPISYTVRPYNSQLDSVVWDEFICRQLSAINTILRDITGLVYSPDCKDNCLFYRCLYLYRLTCILSP